MIPLMMGVVIASFVCMAQGAEHVSPLNPKFFWADSERRRTLEISEPKVVESETFAKLKANEIQRARNNKALLALFDQDRVSIEELKEKLKVDERLMSKSVALFDYFRKQKRAESPKVGSGYERVKPIVEALSVQMLETKLLAESVQRAIHSYVLNGAPLSTKRVCKVLQKLQKERLELFGHFNIDVSLKEEAIGSYHMSAYPHLLLLDAQYHESQRNILNGF